MMQVACMINSGTKQIYIEEIPFWNR